MLLQVGYILTILVSVQWIAIYVLILWDTYDPQKHFMSFDCEDAGVLWIHA